MEVVLEYNYSKKLWVTNIVLSSDDLWSYWVDIWTNLIELFNELLKINYKNSITINYIHPKYFLDNFEDLYDLFSKMKVSSILITIQSNNNRILKMMNRFYDTGLILHNILKLRKLGIKVTNHIITFYPTETFDEFKKNIESIYYYDKVTFNPYYLNINWKKSYYSLSNISDLDLMKLKFLIKISKKYHEKIILENNFYEKFKNFF